MESINRSQLAKILKVSLPTIDGWVRRGCPAKKNKQGWTFKLKEVEQWLDDRRKKALELTPYQKAKEEKIYWQAKMAQLEYEKESGLLVARERYNQKLREIIVIIKDALLLLPKTLPPAIGVDHATQKQVAFGLNTEIKRILRIWASGIEAIKSYTEENRK